jgi:branched-chain amino acid transport system permease protein
MICLFGYLGQCWNILCGYTGQFSFGHAAFFGIGGYVSAYLFIKIGLSPWIGMILGAILASVLGLFIGFLSFRYGLKGFFFALTTLSFSEILRILAQNFMEGKAAGILIPLRGSDIVSFQFQNKISYYYIALGLMLLITFIAYRIEQSALGNKFKAIREDEEAAESIGINTMKYKLIAMGISAFMTALGGTFYTQYILFIDPHMGFGMNITVEMVLRTILGGYGTVLGPLVGSLIITPLSEIPKYFLSSAMGIDLVIYGIVLIIAVVSMPNGILGLYEKFLKPTIGIDKEGIGYEIVAKC